MIGLGLRPLQDELNRKADDIQREFITLGEQSEEIGKQLLEARGEERKQLREEQAAARAQQLQLAEEVNIWRERARDVMQRPGKGSLRAFLNELLELGEDSVCPAIEQVLHILDMPPEELATFDEQPELEIKTPAGRLIERARIEYDLRGSDAGVRYREAVVFANQSGISQDEKALEEIAAAMEDSDPIVRELAILTTVQIHRYRALQIADLDTALDSVQYISRLNHNSVIPALLEVLENPRTGYHASDGEVIESDNSRARMIALLRLVEWHTEEARIAIQSRKFDRDPHIVRAAERALELFPGPWAGPLKGTGPLSME